MKYNHISLSQKESYKRKVIQHGSDINAQEKLYSATVYGVPMWCQSISVFFYPPSNPASSAAVMAAIQ